MPQLDPWSRRFEEPIPLPNGAQLVTLHEVRVYVLELSPELQQERCWQTVAGELLKVAEHGGSFMIFARMATMSALLGRDLRDRPAPGGRKSPQFRRRKLKRDE